VDMDELRARIKAVNLKHERPYIFVNTASSMDGKIALGDGKRLKISTIEDFKRVHRLRNEMDAILVGINTVIKDDPHLYVKTGFCPGPIRNPVRIVVDSNGKIPSESRILSGTTKTIIAVVKGNEENLERLKARETGNIIIKGVEANEEGKVDLHSLFLDLFSENINSILVEGGSTIISSLLRKGYIDTYSIFFRNFIVGGKQAPSIVGGQSAVAPVDLIHLRDPEIVIMEGGMLLSYHSLRQ